MVPDDDNEDLRWGEMVIEEAEEDNESKLVCPDDGDAVEWGEGEEAGDGRGAEEEEEKGDDAEMRGNEEPLVSHTRG